jgi:CubicO group peptidase (beta-lactamase class C family)
MNAAATSQLIAQGKLHLDDDVNLYLPFKVRNPNFPDIPIRIGELLRHRSSIIDNLEYLQPIWDTTLGDPKTPLDVFLKDYLIPGGSHYNKEKNFSNTKPNTQRRYCNVGFALLGYIIECITKQSYDHYCAKNIFYPLDMHQTAFFLKDLDTNLIAMPYHYSDSLHQYIPYGQGGYPEYPAGLVRTSAEQLAHFLIAWTSNGKWQNKPVFDSATIQLFTPQDFRLGCYTWNIFSAPEHDKLKIMYGHTGGDNGAFSIMGYQPDDKKGFILLFNGDFDGRVGNNRKNMYDLLSAIYENIIK